MSVAVLGVAMFVGGFVGGSPGGAPRAYERDLGPAGEPAEAVHLARDVFDRVNAERSHRGLHELAWHDGLAVLAGTWSTRMTVEGFEHSTGEFRAHPDFAGTGENIAMGQRDTRTLHVGWMRSDGHRFAILDPRAVALGVGIVCRTDGSMWSTQIFGYPPADAPPPVLPPPRWPDEPPPDPVVGTDRGLRCPLGGGGR